MDLELNCDRLKLGVWGLNKLRMILASKLGNENIERAKGHESPRKARQFTNS